MSTRRLLKWLAIRVHLSDERQNACRRAVKHVGATIVEAFGSLRQLARRSTKHTGKHVGTRMADQQSALARKALVG